MQPDELAKRLIEKSAGKDRFIVAIAGPPGAGKSTLAEQLVTAIAAKGETARCIPMDGFHLDNVILQARGALKRKGAPFTFDAAGFVNLIKRLAEGEADVFIPIFDRKRDIAIAGADIVWAGDRLLIVEGNYLMLKEEPWAALQGFWDETVFINPGVETLEQRLIERWLTYGMDEQTARAKALQNDIPNAHYVVDNSFPATFQIS